mmetsp:Transcript_84857/g.236766  ORF Transcript_84857/g.236766 Transcript_84857/m.236766 type:complete len:224 (+) Transcript_84857:52-723(+)
MTRMSRIRSMIAARRAHRAPMDLTSAATTAALRVVALSFATASLQGCETWLSSSGRCEYSAYHEIKLCDDCFAYAAQSWSSEDRISLEKKCAKGGSEMKHALEKMGDPRFNKWRSHASAHDALLDVTADKYEQQREASELNVSSRSLASLRPGRLAARGFTQRRQHVFGFLKQDHKGTQHVLGVQAGHADVKASTMTAHMQTKDVELANRLRVVGAARGSTGT